MVYFRVPVEYTCIIKKLIRFKATFRRNINVGAHADCTIIRLHAHETPLHIIMMTIQSEVTTGFITTSGGRICANMRLLTLLECTMEIVDVFDWESSVQQL